MSRVTNSVLLRYGINSFWSSSLFLVSITNFKLSLNAFFKLFLNNYFLKLLKTQYSLKYITLYVFYYKDDAFSFVTKYLMLQKVSIDVLKERKKYTLIKINSNLVQSKNYLLKIKNLFRLLYLSSILCYLIIVIKKDEFKCLIPFISILNSKIFNTFRFSIVSVYCAFNNWKLKRINSIVKLKFIGLFSSILIFHYIKKDFSISLKSLTERKQDFKLPFFFNLNNNSMNKLRFNIIFFSFIFFNASILNYYINSLVKSVKDKKHINAIISFFEDVKIAFLKQIIPLSGVKFQISGRLNGKLRKSRFGYNFGSVKLMSFSFISNYSCDYVFTQYGSFSLKLWLCAITEQSLLIK